MGFLGGLFGKKDKEPPKKAAPIKPIAPIRKGTLPIKKVATPVRKPGLPLKKTAGPALGTAAKTTPPPPREEKSKMSDIDFLREQLREIHDVMGVAEAAPVAPANEKRGFLDVPMARILKVLPPEFVKAGMPEAGQTTVTVIVDNLFDQLKSGRVSTPLGHIISEISDDYLTPEAQKHLEDAISLPLPLVVSSMEPGELKRRTASKDRELGVRGMPNVFSKEQLTTEAAQSLIKAEESAKEKVEAPAPEPEPVAEETEIPAIPTVEPEAVIPEAPEPEPVEDEPAIPEVEPEAVIPEAPAAEEIPIEEPAPVEESVVEDLSAEEFLKGLLEETPEPEPEAIAAETEETAAEEIPQEDMLREQIEEPVAEEPPAPVEEIFEQPVEEAIGTPVEEAPAETPVPVPVSEEVKEGLYLFLRGVDLNAATVEDLTKIDGINKNLAAKIIKAREETGQFFYLSDLMRVPGLGRKSFERITGQKVSSDTLRHADLIHEILGPPKHGIPNVREVVQRFTALEDFEGCIITHADGYTMASSWDHPKEEALGAFTPQMFKKVAAYISQLDMGALSSIIFTLEQQPITIICSGCVYLIAIHVPNRFNKRSVSIAQAIGAEIGRRLTSARDREE